MDLLGLEGEYLAFILDMEVELGLLRHILACGVCREEIKGRITGEEETELGPLGDLFEDAMKASVADLDEFVGRRIAQRIGRLERLMGDADLELEDLRGNLAALNHHDRG